MRIRCCCPACQAKFKVDAKHAGKQVHCPKCQQVVTVPHEGPEEWTVEPIGEQSPGQSAAPSSTVSSSTIKQVELPIAGPPAADTVPPPKPSKQSPPSTVPTTTPASPAPRRAADGTVVLPPMPVATRSSITSPVQPLPATAVAAANAITAPAEIAPAAIVAPNAGRPPETEPSAGIGSIDALAGLRINTSLPKSRGVEIDTAGGATIHRDLRKRTGPLPLILVGGSGALLLVAVGVVLGIAFSQPTRPQTHGTSAAASYGTLTLDWPVDERKGAVLAIDGRSQPFSKAEELRFSLPAGSHHVLIQRLGFEPFAAEVKLASGGTRQVTPQWIEAIAVAAPSEAGASTSIPTVSSTPRSSSPGRDSAVAAGQLATIPGFDGWIQSRALATRQATAEKKDIIIVFGQSDTDPATKKLSRALQAADAQRVVSQMVRLVIDWPQTSGGRELVESPAQNANLLRELQEIGIHRLPVLVLADQEGRAYWMESEWDQGFENLASQLAAGQIQRIERDKLLGAAGQGSEKEQLAAAARATEWLKKHNLWRYYDAELRRWLAMARRIAPDNQGGLLEAFFEPIWLLHVVAINPEDEVSVGDVVTELAPWSALKFQSPDRGANLHTTAAALLLRHKRFDDAAAQMQHSAKYLPNDPKLAEMQRHVRQLLENRDVLGNGTGFLVSSAGFVLTNFHVIKGEGRAEIQIPGTNQSTPVQVVAHDSDRDIALLKVALPDPGKYKALAVSPDNIRRGTPVAAFGYPKADSLGQGLKFTAGAISALPDDSNDQMYLLDVTINPGNSGGPLCDRRGNVVGMIAAKTRNRGSQEDSYGLAIPAADLVRFLDQNLPATAPRPSAARGEPAAGWDAVDEKVSSGVLMILKKK